MITKSKLFFDSLKSLCCIVGIYGLIVVPAMSASLPSGYTQLEYLQSSGTQWIDTGIVPTNTTGIAIKVDDTGRNSPNMGATSAAYFVGDVLSPKYYGYFTRIVNDELVSTWAWNGEGVIGKDIQTANSTIYINYMNDRRFVYNNGISDLFVKTGLETLNTASNNLKLFGIGGNGSYNAAGKMYFAKITNNQSLMRNFIPAKRKSDGVLGMYDTAWDESQYGVVDLGTLTDWNNRESVSSGLFCVTLSDVKPGGTSGAYVNGWTQGSDVANLQFGQLGVHSSLGLVYFRRSEWIGWTAAQVKQAMKGVKLYYQRTTDASFHGPFYTNSGTGVFTGGPEVSAIQIATTAYVEESFKDSVTELNATVGTIKSVVDNTIIQADRIGKLQTGKQTRPAENCPDGAQCLLITEADGSLHWYPICNADGTVGTQSSN